MRDHGVNCTKMTEKFQQEWQGPSFHRDVCFMGMSVTKNCFGF